MAHWREVRWPELEKKARANGWRVVFIGESGFYLLPGLARTLRALRPNAGSAHALPLRTHLWVMAAVTRQGQLSTRLRPPALRREDSVAFLRHLRGHLPHTRLLIIWDGSPIHRYKAMGAFQLTSEAENFVCELLPAYAPDLNPLDTGVWHLLKDVALANVCCHDLKELREALTAAILALRRKPRLIQAAFGNAKLGLG